jgi:hypothetical protein
MQDGFGSAFQQIRDTYVELALPQTDRVVDRDEGIKPDMHRRQRSARAQFAKGQLKDFVELWQHVEGRVAPDLQTAFC